MQAFYTVKDCQSSAGPTTTSNAERNFYLAAERVRWNYAPSGRDLMNDRPLTEAHRWNESSAVILSAIPKSSLSRSAAGLQGQFGCFMT